MQTRAQHDSDVIFLLFTKVRGTELSPILTGTERYVTPSLSLYP